MLGNSARELEVYYLACMHFYILFQGCRLWCLCVSVYVCRSVCSCALVCAEEVDEEVYSTKLF